MAVKFPVSLILVVVLVQQLAAHTLVNQNQPRYYRSSVDGVESVVEVVPSSVTVRPRPRQRISSQIAKQYWTSGNFFNRDSFKAISELDNGSQIASGSIPVPVIIRSNNLPASVSDVRMLQDLGYNV